MAATRALLQGDWAAAYGFISKLPVWALVPQREAVLGMLRTKLQEEGLRTFLFAYSHHYASLSADQLCAMFDLDEKRVYRWVGVACAGRGGRGGAWREGAGSLAPARPPLLAG